MSTSISSEGHCSSMHHLTTPSYSPPESKAHSVDRDLTINIKPTNMSTLNILFLGETRVTLDLITGPVQQQKSLSRTNPRALDEDVCSVMIEGKKFTLYTSPANDARNEGFQEMLGLLRRSGGIHLLVYCMDALHPVKWFDEVHRTIISNAIPSPRIPTVAVIDGAPDEVEQDSWWRSTRDALANQGLHFDDHTFIRAGTRSLAEARISQSRHALHALILRNTDSLAGYDIQPRNLDTIDIVLIGEIGVGKSTLVNLIARNYVAKVSSDTIGCTRTAVKYTFEEKGRIFHLYDTPGLVDPQMGDKLFVDPINIIQQLIRSLGNGNGPDLVLFCIDNSKPTAAFKRNLSIFYKFICGSKVPFALAVTKLEKGAEQWWNQYGGTIRKYGIDQSRYIGFGREKRHPDPKLDPEGQLRERLLSFFASCTDRQKNKAISVSLRSSMERVIFFLRSRASTPERVLMKQCGLEAQTARELVNRIVSSKNQSVDGHIAQ